MQPMMKETAFETVHADQLMHAIVSLRREGRYGRWRIALCEPPQPVPPSDVSISDDEMNITVINVMLSPNGLVMVADQASQKAIDEWEQRNAEWHLNDEASHRLHFFKRGRLVP
jgi:hypothetical protein